MHATNFNTSQPPLEYIRNSRPQRVKKPQNTQANFDKSLHQKRAEIRTRTFFLQAAARDCLRHERVSFCTRLILPHKSKVDVMKHVEESQSVHFRNLAVCASVWHCPLCSQRISEYRREELSRAVQASGYNVALLTYTLRHRKNTSLKVVLDKIQDAYRRTKSGRAYQRIKDKLGIVGSIKALEVTYGEHGWHPHIHELLIMDARDAASIAAIDEEVRKLWLDRVKKVGGYASKKHGFKVSDHQANIDEYVTKYGRLPERLTDGEGNQTWSLEHELTKAASKRAKSEHGFTPFALLEMYASSGDEMARDLFQEYAMEFKGRQQLQWSRGLKKLLGVDEIADEIAAEAHEHAEGYELLASIDLLTWREILRRGERAEILNAAARMNAQELQNYILIYHPDFPRNVNPDATPLRQIHEERMQDANRKE